MKDVKFEHILEVFLPFSEKLSPLNKVNIIYSCQCINIGTITFLIQDQSTEVRSEI